MSIDTKLNHVALHCSDRAMADIFFIRILDLEKIKQFNLSSEISEMIFGIKKPVEIDVYGNNFIHIEAFFIKDKRPKDFTHVCININDRTAFIRRCEQYKLIPYTVNKDGKEHLFVRDFSENLFEVKETK